MREGSWLNSVAWVDGFLAGSLLQLFHVLNLQVKEFIKNISLQRHFFLLGIAYQILRPGCYLVFDASRDQLFIGILADLTVCELDFGKDLKLIAEDSRV